MVEESSLGEENIVSARKDVIKSKLDNKVNVMVRQENINNKLNQRMSVMVRQNNKNLDIWNNYPLRRLQNIRITDKILALKTEKINHLTALRINKSLGKE